MLVLLTSCRWTENPVKIVGESIIHRKPVGVVLPLTPMQKELASSFPRRAVSVDSMLRTVTCNGDSTDLKATALLRQPLQVIY